MTVLLGMFLATAAATETVESAKRAFDTGDYSRALVLFEQANRQSPACETSFYIGLARYRLKQENDAIIAFKAAVQCNPKLLPAYLALAEAYINRRNEAEALAAYTQALTFAPWDAATLRGAITLYLRNEMEEKALPLLQTLVAVDANDVQARVDLAAVHAATGNREKAEAEFGEALRRKPDFAPALMGLGNLHVKAGEDERGIPLLQLATAAQPEAYEPHFLLGSAYNRLGRFAEALKEFEAALQTGGSAQPEVHYQMARTYGGLNRADDRRAALARFAEITRQGKENVETQRRASRLVNDARSHLESGNLDAAVNSLEEARQLKAGDATLLFRLAGLHYDLQRLDRAREYVQAAISISPSVWLHHYLLGLIENSAGRWSDARQSLETAARLNPSGAEIHNALGETALRQGDMNRAVASFERASQLAPAEDAYRRNLDAARNAKRR